MRFFVCNCGGDQKTEKWLSPLSAYNQGAHVSWHSIGNPLPVQRELAFQWMGFQKASYLLVERWLPYCLKKCIPNKIATHCWQDYKQNVRYSNIFKYLFVSVNSQRGGLLVSIVIPASLSRSISPEFLCSSVLFKSLQQWADLGAAFHFEVNEESWVPTPGIKPLPRNWRI